MEPTSRPSRAALACLIAAFLLSFPGRAADLTVSAAVSLKGALEEIARAYEKKTRDRITCNFGASGALQRQIENGAPVDVFLSAAVGQIDELDGKGLLAAGTRKVLLRNSLVLVVPRGKSKIAGFDDLRRPAARRIAVGEPKTVPAGQYAAEVLEKLELTRELAPKLVPSENVRQVLTYVETENVDAGVVYATDALDAPKVAIAATADPSWHSPILYPVAVVKATKHEAAAKGFTTYLFDEEAAKVFRKHGFLVDSDTK